MAQTEEKNCKCPEPVPYIVHESSLARMERVQRRFTLLLLVELAALIASNAYWLVRIFG